MIIQYRSSTITYIDLQLDKQTVSCLTLNWEFTAKLVFSSDLIYQLFTYQCIKELNRNNTKEPQHQI